MSTEWEVEAPTDSERVTPLGLAWLHVHKLHGKFSYDVELAPTKSGVPTPAATGELFAVNEDRLTLLYGNNGTGKTSVLRALFHALSPAHNRGHRSALLHTRFARVGVQLSDGTQVNYARPEDRLDGPYTAEIASGRTDERTRWEFSGDKRSIEQRAIAGVAGEEIYYYRDDQAERSEFLEALAALEINPVFLEDTRAITADVLEEDARLRRARTGARLADVDELLRQRRDLDVTAALDRARTYLSQLAFLGTQAGSQRVDQVYLGVSAAIVQHASKVGRPSKGLLPALQSRIATLGERAQPFHHYGLLPEFPAARLAELLDEAPAKNGPLLERVLGPYLDGLVERMDALEPGLQAISSYIDALNSFLEDKVADFRPGRPGIRIVDQTTEERLEPSSLSSGEKQIVLLFSDIIALQGQTRLFIIDEPELSLNPHWQRTLMPALLGVTAGSGMQVLAATHSIEIMAKYRRRIRRLEQSWNRDDG